MKTKWIYLLMLLGAVMAFSRSFFKEYEQFLLIGGMMLLMFGIYNISKNLGSKNTSSYQPQDETYPNSPLHSSTFSQEEDTTEKKVNEQTKNS